jgi:hypothetical protein
VAHDDAALAQRGGQRAASRPGWRAKTKLAADGSTSKPSAELGGEGSRLAITWRRVVSKWASSSIAALAPTRARRSSG